MAVKLRAPRLRQEILVNVFKRLQRAHEDELRDLEQSWILMMPPCRNILCKATSSCKNLRWDWRQDHIRFAFHKLTHACHACRQFQVEVPKSEAKACMRKIAAERNSLEEDSPNGLRLDPSFYFLCFRRRERTRTGAAQCLRHSTPCGTSRGTGTGAAVIGCYWVASPSRFTAEASSASTTDGRNKISE